MIDSIIFFYILIILNNNKKGIYKHMSHIYVYEHQFIRMLIMI